MKSDIFLAILEFCPNLESVQMKFFSDGCVWDLITQGSEQEENRTVKGDKVYDHVTERFNYPQNNSKFKKGA